MFKPCIIVPIFNHSQYLAETLKRIRAVHGCAILVVDDGSDSEHQQVIEALIEQAIVADVQLIRLTQNSGKGAAVCQGFITAHEKGYSHALQIDADGQHACEDIPMLFDLASKRPNAIICGVPEYDASVPKGRLYGRYITHFWVWVETLSLQIKDSMCGFRLYPLETTAKLVAKRNIGKRMDFDTDIIVRLYWAGLSIVNVPTRVTYPDDGASHFRMGKDNLLISWMHTRLFFQMLPRSPILILRNIKRWLGYE